MERTQLARKDQVWSGLGSVRFGAIFGKGDAMAIVYHRIWKYATIGFFSFAKSTYAAVLSHTYHVSYYNPTELLYCQFVLPSQIL